MTYDEFLTLRFGQFVEAIQDYRTGSGVLLLTKGNRYKISHIYKVYYRLSVMADNGIMTICQPSDFKIPILPSSQPQTGWAPMNYAEATTLTIGHSTVRYIGPNESAFGCGDLGLVVGWNISTFTNLPSASTVTISSIYNKQRICQLHELSMDIGNNTFQGHPVPSMAKYYVPPKIEFAPVDLTIGKDSVCAHDWSTYQGLFEHYEFCKKCNEKKGKQ